MADPQSYRPSNIPTDPGVYRFYDAKGVVIYVGKALNLKNRLNSYFGSNLTEKTYRMVHKAVHVDWTIVNTEVEALQLEFTWIKSYDPEFNVQFKDDKSYPYLAISINEDFPKIYVSRQKKIKGTKYFGPFAHTWALRSTFDTLQRIYPVRSCSNGTFERAVKSKRQCLLGDIGKCSAPCVGWISQEEHKDLAKKLVKYLDSNPSDIEAQIQSEMEVAAAHEEYERAAKLRDQLTAIMKSNEIMGSSLSPNFTSDVIGIHEEVTHCAASLFTIRNGRIVGSRSWIIDMANVLDGEDLIGATLSKIYLDNEIPREILIDRESGDISEFENWLSGLCNHKVEISKPQRGEKAEMIDVVKRNAHQALIQYLSKRSNDAAVSGAALEEIASALDLAELPLRIECFDISNIQGNHMVASMVVFEDGQSKKSEYRRFAIDDDASFDDTRAMHHVITRRLKRYLAEKDIDLDELAQTGGARPKFAYPPQLIVVDGGQPQVAAAAQALADLGITNIALVGLAKRLEEVWLPGNPDPIIFPRHSEALYLLQRIRDEAHRFAITFHRSKRSKVMLESLLDGIPSLGEVRRRSILEHFGSVTALRKATKAEISEIPGIGERTAEIILANLQPAADSVDMATGEILDASDK
jgi:excinuclease ABC subunit C